MSERRSKSSRETLVISEGGQRELDIINEAQTKNMTITYDGHRQIGGPHGDPTLINFGDLSDPKSPCSIVIEDYHVAKENIADDYGWDRKETITFTRSIAVDLLSQVEPGKPVIVRGGADYDYKYDFHVDNYFVTETKKDYLLNHQKKHARVFLILGMRLSEEADKVDLFYSYGSEADERLTVENLTFPRAA